MKWETEDQLWAENRRTLREKERKTERSRITLEDADEKREEQRFKKSRKKVRVFKWERSWAETQETSLESDERRENWVNRIDHRKDETSFRCELRFKRRVMRSKREVDRNLRRKRQRNEKKWWKLKKNERLFMNWKSDDELCERALLNLKEYQTRHDKHLKVNYLWNSFKTFSESLNFSLST